MSLTEQSHDNVMTPLHEHYFKMTNNKQNEEEKSNKKITWHAPSNPLYVHH